MAKRRSWWLNGTLAAGLVAAVAATAVIVGGDATATQAQASTATAQTGPVTATVAATGNLSADSEVGVDFRGASGTVTGIFVDVGDRVRPGQALARIDSTDARQSLRTAQAALRSAQGQLTSTTQAQTPEEAANSQASVSAAEVAEQNAQLALQQARESLTQEQDSQDALVGRAADNYAASQQTSDAAATADAKSALEQARSNRDTAVLAARHQVQTAEGQLRSAQASVSSARATAAVAAQPAGSGAVTSAQAQVDSAQVQVDQAQTALDRTLLRAPVAGTVTSISGAVGGTSSTTSTGTSSSSSSSNSSTSDDATGFIVLKTLNQLQVTGTVAEADATDVQVGQQVAVTFSAAGVTTGGTVSELAVQNTTTDNVVEYGVTVTLNDPPRGLKLGQTASLSITTGEKQDVLTVPSAAVTTTGGRSTVTVTAGTAEETRTIEVGLVGDSTTEVLSGLKAGEVVVLPEAGGLPAGFSFPGGGLSGGLGGGVG